MTDTNDSAARLAGIRERAEAAAPGPWWFKWEHGETRDGEFFGFVHFTEFLEGESESWVRIQGEDYRENADFIARSREDIPYLLAELDAAKAEIAAAKSFGGGFYGDGVEESTREVYRKAKIAELEEQ